MSGAGVPRAEGRVSRESVLPRPVRVMHLLPELRLGGMEKGVVKLVNALQHRRVASSVCSFDTTDEIRRSLNPQVSVFVLGRRPGNDPLLVLRLVRLLRRERPDIVHSHSWGTLCEGYVAARVAGVGLFIHGEHGTMELRPRNVRVQRWVWSRADQILSVSSTLADRMAEEIGIPRERVRVILNGADLARFRHYGRSVARGQLQIDDNCFVVGTVGRLVPVKDHAALLEALGLLVIRGVRCQALIVGDGPLGPALRAHAERLGLGAVVRFLGSRSDVERVFQAIDLFVLTSSSEGLPNTVLEAMASGLPVVSTDVGGVAELVEQGKTGILVPSGEPVAIADAIAALADDPCLRVRMGQAGRQRACEGFDIRRMVDDYERLYLDLVSPSLRSGSRGTEQCVESPAE